MVEIRKHQILLTGDNLHKDDKLKKVQLGRKGVLLHAWSHAEKITSDYIQKGNCKLSLHQYK